MKYCSECKKLCNGADTICTDCNKSFKEVKDINEPVLLCVIGGVQRNMVCGALTDAQIPFVEKQYGKLGVVNETVTGYDAKLLNIAVEVPYSAVPKAYDIISSIGIECRFDESILDEVKADIEKYKAELANDDTTPMSAAKRATVKTLSIIGFIILVALVVWGTDYITELIKNLFGG